MQNFQNDVQLHIENDDKYCLIWSILALLHSIADSKNGHPARLSNYRQLFIELNIQGFDFTIRFKGSDAYKLE